MARKSQLLGAVLALKLDGNRGAKCLVGGQSAGCGGWGLVDDLELKVEREGGVVGGRGVRVLVKDEEMGGGECYGHFDLLDNEGIFEDELGMSLPQLAGDLFEEVGVRQIHLEED